MYPLLFEACSERILERLPGAPAMYRFTHALVRETVYDAIPEPTRQRLHQGIGQAFEDVCPADVAENISSLAYHYFRSLPLGNFSKAIEYAVRAAERATRHFAYEDAVEHYTRAIVAESAQCIDAIRHCSLLLALGQALIRAGDLVRAKGV